MATLITQAEIVTLAINNPSFDTALIKDYYIYAAEYDYLRPILTEDLYDFILAGSLTGKFATLLSDYIKPYLAFKTLEISLPFIHAQLTAQGIEVMSSEFAAKGTDKQRADLSTAARMMSDTYAKKMVDYIEHDDNISTFEIYYEKGVKISASTNIIAGIVFTEQEDEETGGINV